MRRITTKQYPIKKRIQLDPNDSRKARINDIRNLMKKRSDELKNDELSQQQQQR